MSAVEVQLQQPPPLHVIENTQSIDERVEAVSSDSSLKPLTRSHSLRLIRRTRYIKLLNTFVFLIMAILLVVVGASGDTSGYHVVAYLVSVVYVIGGIYFLLIILGSNNLHYIYVERKAIHGFQNFVVPESIIEEPTRTIKSVSAVTATFGSNAHGLFSRSAHATVGAVFATIVIHGNDQNIVRQSHETVASVLMLIGIFGNAIYGTWELEGTNNHLATTMHYSCAPMIFILQTLAYCIQQQWNTLSTVLFVLGIVLDVFYVIILYRLPETSDNLKHVHWISSLCVISEFCALVVPCLSVVLFVYSL